MASQGILLPLILLYIRGSWAEITLTQTPNFITATPGQTVTMSCKSSTGISYYLNWYQQKPGQPPTLIIKLADELHSGASNRYSGSGRGTDFTLTIRDVKDEDAANYYCQQSSQYPLTFGQFTTVEIKRRENSTPAAIIFRPAEEQIKEGKASIVCLVEKFYPGDAKVFWKVDNSPITNGVETSDKIKDVDSTYSLSSFLTMTSTEFSSHKEITCEVTHATLTSALVTTLKTSECAL